MLIVKDLQTDVGGKFFVVPWTDLIVKESYLNYRQLFVILRNYFTIIISRVSAILYLNGHVFLCFMEAFRSVMKTNLRLKTEFEMAHYILRRVLKYDIKICVGI
jgi:hypothetical protein